MLPDLCCIALAGTSESKRVCDLNDNGPDWSRADFAPICALFMVAVGARSVRLSHSIWWRLGAHRRRHGAALASQCGRTIAAFAAEQKGEGVLNILVLDCGLGEFAYLVIRSFRECRAKIPCPVRFILSDPSLANVNRCRDNVRFRTDPDVEFAVFDVEVDDSLTLLTSNSQFKPSKHAMFIVAESVFLDRLRHDVLRFASDGGLEEGVLTLSSPRSNEPDCHDPSLRQRLRVSFAYKRVPAERSVCPKPSFV